MADNLKQIREANRLTQQDLERMLGLGWEASRRTALGEDPREVAAALPWPVQGKVSRLERQEQWLAIHTYWTTLLGDAIRCGASFHSLYELACSGITPGDMRRRVEPYLERGVWPGVDICRGWMGRARASKLPGDQPDQERLSV